MLVEHGARRVIANPVSGERIVIQTSAADSAGRVLCFDLFLPPGGHVPARHVHPEQVERFSVVHGQLRFRVGRRTLIVRAGEQVEVPAGTAHWFGNPGPEEAHARVEVEPALRTEELFAASEAMASTGGWLGTNLPRPRALARLLLEFQHEVAVPDVPLAISRTLLAWFQPR